MHDFAIGIPYSGCEYKSILPCTREDEAVAIAAGAAITGKRPFVFMQNSGLGHCVDIITSLLKPYDIKINFAIHHRFQPEHHRFMGEIDHGLIGLLGI